MKQIKTVEEILRSNDVRIYPYVQQRDRIHNAIRAHTEQFIELAADCAEVTIADYERPEIIEILNSCSRKRGANSFHHACNMCSYEMILEICIDAMHRIGKAYVKHTVSKKILKLKEHLK